MNASKLQTSKLCWKTGCTQSSMYLWPSHWKVLTIISFQELILFIKCSFCTINCSNYGIFGINYVTLLHFCKALSVFSNILAKQVIWCWQNASRLEVWWRWRRRLRSVLLSLPFHPPLHIALSFGGKIPAGTSTVDLNSGIVVEKQ